jgi:hypothetical protein
MPEACDARRQKDNRASQYRLLQTDRIRRLINKDMKKRIQFWITGVSFGFDETFSGRMNVGQVFCEVQRDNGTQFCRVYEGDVTLLEFNLIN